MKGSPWCFQTLKSDAFRRSSWAARSAAWALIHMDSMPVASGLALLLCGSALSAAEVVARPGDLESAARRWQGAVFVALYAGVPLLMILALRKLGTADQGTRFLYLCLAATWSNDTMAYFAGRTFGKRKMHPTISPKRPGKVLRGASLAASAAAFVCKSLFLPELSWAVAAVYGLVMAPLVPLGDLAESVLKRVSGVKDSGQLIPDTAVSWIASMRSCLRCRGPISWLCSRSAHDPHRPPRLHRLDRDPMSRPRGAVPQSSFAVVGLGGGRQLELLAQQAKRFRPSWSPVRTRGTWRG